MSFTELANRAVACKHWAWTPGMRGIRTFWHPTLHKNVTVHVRVESSLDVEIVAGPTDQALVSSAYCIVSGWTKLSDMRPDFDDPATVGCLLALVRKAWNMPKLHIRPEGDGYRVWGDEPGAILFESEVCALVHYLEAAGEAMISEGRHEMIRKYFSIWRGT